MVKNVSEIIYNEKCSRRFGRNHGPSSGEVKEKILYKNTDINKTLIKIPKCGSFFLLARVKCKHSLGGNAPTSRLSGSLAQLISIPGVENLPLVPIIISPENCGLILWCIVIRFYHGICKG